MKHSVSSLNYLHFISLKEFNCKVAKHSTTNEHYITGINNAKNDKNEVKNSVKSISHWAENKIRLSKVTLNVFWQNYIPTDMYFCRT